MLKTKLLAAALVAVALSGTAFAQGSGSGTAPGDAGVRARRRRQSRLDDERDRVGKPPELRWYGERWANTSHRYIARRQRKHFEVGGWRQHARNGRRAGQHGGGFTLSRSAAACTEPLRTTARR